jgi:hypothetical protein
MVNTSQQIGGSVGTALLSSIFASAVSGYLVSHRATPRALTATHVHGYSVGFEWAAGIFFAGLVIALLLVPWIRPGPTGRHPAPARPSAV